MFKILYLVTVDITKNGQGGSGIGGRPSALHLFRRTHPRIKNASHVRHTYATILYNAGVDIKSAQRFLGHADIKVTLKIYTHLSEQKEQEAITALNKHLAEKTSGKNPNAVKMQ